MAARSESTWFLLLKLLFVHFCVAPGTAEESRECREQEYKDLSGTCVPCQQCGAGQELSQECGFGFGAVAVCVPCRPRRFKETAEQQKCKPCLDCSLLNRTRRTNCSASANAVCGDCLPGFYRKAQLRGFQDMECVPCGHPPPPHEPLCSGRVNLVPLASTVTRPRDVALAAVICSALASVLLALLLLCATYCKRQILAAKSTGPGRVEDGPYSGAELSCLDRHRVVEFPRRPCCHCSAGPGRIRAPLSMIPSLHCDETCGLGDHGDTCPLQSYSSRSNQPASRSVGKVHGELGSPPDLQLRDQCPLRPDGLHHLETPSSEAEKQPGLSTRPSPVPIAEGQEVIRSGSDAELC